MESKSSERKDSPTPEKAMKLPIIGYKLAPNGHFWEISLFARIFQDPISLRCKIYNEVPIGSEEPGRDYIELTISVDQVNSWYESEQSLCVPYGNHQGYRLVIPHMEAAQILQFIDDQRGEK